MSAFYKFQNPIIGKNESLSDFKKRMINEQSNVTILSDNELANLTMQEVAELHSINYSKYIKIYGKWEDEYNHLAIGQEIIVGIFDIEPRSMCDKCWQASEWDIANVGGSMTESLIEVDKRLVIQDGHNRLKTFIARGDKYIKVKIVD